MFAKRIRFAASGLLRPYNRKVVVLHSDDWGSIRMPSEKVRLRLNSNPRIDASDVYSRNDTLASVEDLDALFSVLDSFRDINNRPAILTANCVMCNPDFSKIKLSDYSQYFPERLETTFDRYNNNKALGLWKEGMERNLFYPQYHGREHVDINSWLRSLQAGHSGVIDAFNNEVFGVNFRGIDSRKPNFQAAWDFRTIKEEAIIIEGILEGLKRFRDYFGFNSQTCIAPSYTWSRNIEKALKDNAVRSMQGIVVQKVPNGFSKNYKFKYHLLDRKDYQTRNVFFEPTIFGRDVVSDSLKNIDLIFKYRLPAIISMHRVNFIGALNPHNRKSSLTQLKLLLSEIRRRWPDCEFMNAQELFEMQST